MLHNFNIIYLENKDKLGSIKE